MALLIGSSRYRGNSPRLPAVINDIAFTRKKLEELQFKVISLVDLDLTEMRKAISWFCDLLAEGVYGKSSHFQMLHLFTDISNHVFVKQ